MAGDAVPATAAATTGARLASALLGYFVLVTVVITLSPFDFAARPFSLSFELSVNDLLANLALFLPIGFLLRSVFTRRQGRAHAVAIAASLSLAIEVAQIFLRDRYVSPLDVAANASGAWVGAMIRDRVERSPIWHPTIVGRFGLDIPLVGLLYLLLPQLWLSGIGWVGEPFRSVTTLLLGSAGSIVLVALHRHRWRGGLGIAARAVLPLALLWFMVGALPALTASPRTVAVQGLAVVLVTLLLLRERPAADERRFEIETLRRFLPVFSTYLAVSALWPPLRSFSAWHGSVGFVDRLNNAAVIDVLVLLEQVGAFTLFGYAVAEWRGRSQRRFGGALARVTLVSALVAALLEAAQGVLSGPGASLLRALLSTSGAMYGAAVYHLARAHVRTLRASGPARP